MSKKKSKFIRAIDQMEAAAKVEYESCYEKNADALKGPNCPGRARDMRKRWMCEAGETLSVKMVKFQKLRDLAPMVDAGLMTAADAVKQVFARRIAASKIAARKRGPAVVREGNDGRGGHQIIWVVQDGQVIWRVTGPVSEATACGEQCSEVWEHFRREAQDVANRS